MILSKKANRLFSSTIWLLPVLPRHVLLKVTRLLAWETALIASVGFFSSVSALVSFLITRHSARIVALITPERLPTWVGSNMYLGVTCRRAGKITLVATKRLLFWMSAHVFLGGISLCAWIVTLVAGQRKICIGINLWKVSANTELCTMRFTLQTKTKKGGERNPQTPYVCLLVHSNFSSKHSHSVSYRSKTIQLPVVWIQMHNKWWPQETRTDTFRREALHLHAVWVLLHNS